MSLGGELKALREKGGFSMDDVSEKTHIGAHILENLERDDFSRISAPVYGSGFVKILANFYGIDGTHLRELFAEEYAAYAKAKAALPVFKAPPQKYFERRGYVDAVTQPQQQPVPQPVNFAEPRVAATKVTRPQPFGELFSDRDLGIEDALPPAPAEPAPPAPVEPPAPAPSAPSAPAAPPAPPPSAPTPPPRVSPKLDKCDPSGCTSSGAALGGAPSRLAEWAREIKPTVSQFCSSVVSVVKMRKFQRIAAAALILFAGASFCLLIVGGDGAEPPPEPFEEPVAEATVAQPEPASEAVSEPAPQPEPVVFVGSALKDYLVPPPDRYAE